MRHGILFFSLLVLLFGAAGGVFILVNNGEQEEIQKDAFVASVSGGGRVELDGDSQTDEKQAPKVEVNPQSVPKPIAKQPTLPPPASKSVLPPTPIASPTPESLPSPDPTVPSGPTEESVPAPQPPAREPKQPQGKININTASLEELDQITGVGPSIAQNIVEYRNSSGLFYYIEDIKNVSGIADVKFGKMKDEIMVGNVAPPTPPPPPPTPAPPPISSHIFYTSSYWSSKLYYCDTDSRWKNLSEKYLESYSAEEELLGKYPEKTLHEPCE